MSARRKKEIENRKYFSLSAANVGPTHTVVVAQVGVDVVSVHKNDDIFVHTLAPARLSTWPGAVFRGTALRIDEAGHALYVGRFRILAATRQTVENRNLTSGDSEVKTTNGVSIASSMDQ
jgi:hypothetical protein